MTHDTAATLTTHSDEWFTEAFTNPVTREPHATPVDIRTAATRIVRSYNIKGICDPQYIANVIAKETGRGDGKSNFPATFTVTIGIGNDAFTYDPAEETATILEKVAQRLREGAVAGTTVDSNGNTVGSFAILP